ncbi:copper-binding protein, partial [Alkalihalobacillus clausii]|uniref:copper-binding protein n=1 Tax=Shouchella clausii TaxID=79880 RepID=UPI001C0B794A
SVGKIVALDRKAATITLQHDPRSAGDWPTMRLPATVRPGSLLSAVKVGDQVRFHLEYRSGAPEVVALEADTRTEVQARRQS